MTYFSFGQQDYQKYTNLSYTEIDSLTYIEYSKGTFNKAIPLMKAGRYKARAEFGEQDSIFAEYTSNVAFFYIRTGQYDKALPLCIQAKNIAEKVLGQEHPHFAKLLNNLAALHRNMRNYDKALPLYIQAKDIKGKVLGTEHPKFAVALNNLAVLHKKMKNYNKALPLYMQAKTINEKALGIEHREFATSLNNLAALYRDMGFYEKALPLLIQAKTIRGKVLGMEHPEFAISISNLASLYRAMENYEEALPLLVQAKNINEKILGTEHPNFANSLNALAFLHLKMGNYDKAKLYLTQAIQTMSLVNIHWNINKAWADSLLGAKYPSNSHLEEMLVSLGHTYYLLQEDNSIAAPEEQQRTVANLAIQLLNKLQHQVSNEKDKLRILNSSSEWVNKSLMVLNAAEHNAQAFALADQSKSVLLLQATKSETAYRLGGVPDSLISQNKKLLKKQSKLQAKLLERRSKEEKNNYRNKLNHVNEEIEGFVKMLETDYPKYHKLKYQQVNTKVKEIQALLDDNTALLEYAIGDSVVHIFRLDKEGVQWKKSFISAKELKRNIKELHNALSNYKTILSNKEKAYQNYIKKAHWFYQQLLAPVLDNQNDIQNLIIVTDGELGHLPFETFLISPASQSLKDYQELHYLVDDYNISYNYSAILWKENKEAPIPQNNGQIFGLAANYKLQLDSSMRELRLSSHQSLRKSLPPLPAARQEVEILQQKYQGFFAFDLLASEKTVKAKASEFAVLHFATHGLVDNKRPILSSLALTEDNDSIESNFWEAHEISKIELNANLVVLSACETGYGQFEKGNGIASLARSFMYAGASALIVSLWQVNDYATSEIMKNLYANLANGMHKDEALRQAKLDYMKSAKGVIGHPAFWSPFIMIGNTQPVSIKTKESVLPWIIGGFGVLFLIGMGLLVRRRGKEVV